MQIKILLLIVIFIAKMKARSLIQKKTKIDSIMDFEFEIELDLDHGDQFNNLFSDNMFEQKRHQLSHDRRHFVRTHEFRQEVETEFLKMIPDWMNVIADSVERMSQLRS